MHPTPISPSFYKPTIEAIRMAELTSQDG